MISIHHNEIQIIAIIKNLYKYFSEVKICCQSVKQLEYYNRQINTVYWILTINSSKRDSIPLQILNSNCFADFLQSILWGFIWGFSLELLNLQLKVLTTHYWPMFPFYPIFFQGVWNRSIGHKWDALHELVPFVQFKKRERHPWRNVTFSKVAGWLKVTLLHGSFSRFLNCTDGTKSRSVLHGLS